MDETQARDPIALLMDEHRLIERVLSALERYAGAVERGVCVRGDLLRFVTFIREFADARHHRKEEDVLFVAMVANGFPADGGPIAVMLHEHELGRELIGELAGLAETCGAWTAEDATRLAAAAREYAGLLRCHIAKEDQVLYQMARSVLPPPAMHEVALCCQAIEQEYARGDADARLAGLGTELARRYAS